MRIVIMGCGRTGSTLALLMSCAGHQVTVIEKSQDALLRLGKRHKCDVVVGDGLDEDTLRRAEVDKADAFIACTNGDNTNLMVVQMARELFGVKRIAAKVNDPVRAEAYREYGIFTVTSGSLLAGYLRDWMLGNPTRNIEEYNQFYPELRQLLED
ncbi:MAG: TrkA family potassium uptake protein [Fimbriimonadales bacterium]|nr:TrkA family potassium uptake protein [Fimbriimonadales bacterium]